MTHNRSEYYELHPIHAINHTTFSQWELEEQKTVLSSLAYMFYFETR